MQQPTPWPCNTCGAAGVRNVGTEGKCARHLAELYNTFNPTVFKLNGVGLPGATTDDQDLTCCACDATWTGPAGEPCYYCARAHQIQLNHQAELVTTPPDVDPDDTTYQPRMQAWATRMRTAIEAGIITDTEARTAWRRQAGQHALIA